MINLSKYRKFLERKIEDTNAFELSQYFWQLVNLSDELANYFEEIFGLDVLIDNCIEDTTKEMEQFEEINNNIRIKREMVYNKLINLKVTI